MNTTATARARSMKMTRWAWTPELWRPLMAVRGAGERSDTRLSVRHGMQQNVDAEGVAVRRELQEELGVLSLALPRIGHVRVVGHHHHDATVGITNRLEFGERAVLVALPGFEAATAPPEPDVGDLGHFPHSELRVEDGIRQRHVLDRIVPGVEYVGELRGPLLPGRRAPEVVHPQEATLQQVGAQPR